MHQSHALFLAVACLGCTAAAHADKVSITGDGFSFHIKEMGALNLPNFSSNTLTGQDLQAIHASINAANIGTEGKVTFVFLNTHAGLSLFALVDNPNISGPKVADAMLGVSTTVNGANDFAMKDTNFFSNGGSHTENGNTQSLEGSFFWHPDGGATGMAWTGLSHGDSGTFDFSAILGGDAPTFAGLTANNKFQFLSWTGTTWNNKFKGTFDSSGSFSFAFAVVPLPPALGLGLAGLGMVAVARRRRKAVRAE